MQVTNSEQEMEALLDELMDMLSSSRPRSVGDSQWSEITRSLDEIFEERDDQKSQALRQSSKELPGTWGRAIGRIAKALLEHEDAMAIRRLGGVKVMLEGSNGAISRKQSAAEAIAKMDVAVRQLATADSGDARARALGDWDRLRAELELLLGK